MYGRNKEISLLLIPDFSFVLHVYFSLQTYENPLQHGQYPFLTKNFRSNYILFRSTFPYTFFISITSSTSISPLLSITKIFFAFFHFGKNLTILIMQILNIDTPLQIIVTMRFQANFLMLKSINDSRGFSNGRARF